MALWIGNFGRRIGGVSIMSSTDSSSSSSEEGDLLEALDERAAGVVANGSAMLVPSYVADTAAAAGSTWDLGGGGGDIHAIRHENR